MLPSFRGCSSGWSTRRSITFRRPLTLLAPCPNLCKDHDGPARLVANARAVPHGIHPSLKGIALSDVASQTGRRTRWIALAVLVVYAALAALLVYDIANPTDSGYQVIPVKAHRLVDVTASIGRARGVNPIIAVAARESGGSKTTLELPPGFGELLAREPDTFTRGVVPTINKGLIDPFLGGRVREADYDPVLDAAQAAAVDSDPASVELPMDVWFVSDTEGAQVVRLYTDPTRMRIYILPEGYAEGAGR